MSEMAEGWQLVPKVPSAEMVDAFNNAGAAYNKGGKTFATFSERYAAMLKAAPSLSGGQEKGAA